jgi:hypothetical protein
MIKTTICLETTARERLEKASSRTGLSSNSIIRLITREAVGEMIGRTSAFKRLQYRGKMGKDAWRRFHIALDEKEYELLHDVRKFFKMSFSLFLHLAIEMFLDSLIGRLTKREGGSDNYLFTCYSMVRTLTLQGQIFWKVYWGLPDSVP